MKIIRKKRNGISIKHNKKLLWIIIILVILLIFLIFKIVDNSEEGIDNREIDENNDGADVKCSSDSDCIKVQTGCCSCNMGGEEKCILKSEEKDYLGLLEDCPDKMICAAVYNCHIKTCKCINGECLG